MSKGVNKVIIIGNLGSIPTIRVAPDGMTVANLSVATGSGWVDKNTGEKKEQTEWHKIVCYKKTAEFVRDFLQKGSKVYVEGSLRTRQWENKNDGTKHTTTEIIAQTIQGLSPKNAPGASDNGYAASQGNHYDSEFVPATPNFDHIPF